MNDELIKSKVIQLLKDLLDGKKPIVLGCMELSALWHEGYDFIDYDIVEHYDNMLHIPLPTEHHLWNQAALNDRLKELEAYRPKVLSTVKSLLDDLLRAEE
ncbi:hypothetical protein ACFFSY_01530 [Paenibacillus aurantiacus]|uniref:DUF2489 domain-containing protein n=1 Tax=Paenibacillus aurantiacus TaxID=1936118 RepID=A0ABV5KK38_9BACL